MRSRHYFWMAFLAVVFVCSSTGCSASEEAERKLFREHFITLQKTAEITKHTPVGTRRDDLLKIVDSILLDFEQSSGFQRIKDRAAAGDTSAIQVMNIFVGARTALQKGEADTALQSILSPTEWEVASAAFGDGIFIIVFSFACPILMLAMAGPVLIPKFRDRSIKR